MSSDIVECPAFVDTHSHDDIALLGDPGRPDKTNQGIGVQVIGNCGLTPFPVLPESCGALRRLLASVIGPVGDYPAFASIAEYRKHLARTDIVTLQGYNALRASLFGPENRRLDMAEQTRMAGAIDRAVEQGAAGISLGLAYPPAVACDAEELEEIGRRTPLLTVHLRNESSEILESVAEAASIARKAKCHLHISHLKISGRAFWPNAERLVQTVKKLHEDLGVTFDHYPYSFGCTGLSAILPPELSTLPAADLAKANLQSFESRFRDADWENYVLMCGWEGIELVSLEKNTEYNHRRISELGRSKPGVLRRLILEEPHPAMLIHSQSEDLIDELLRLPFGCVGTDGLPPVREHPRLTSTFPEYLSRCRRIGMTADAAVEKAALLPRKIFGIDRKIGGTVRFDWPTGRILSPPGTPEPGAGRKKAR